MRKAIIKRSELATKFLKSPTEENSRAYKKQKKYCRKLFQKDSRKFYSDLDLKKITDNNKFWSTIKPFLSNYKLIT